MFSQEKITGTILEANENKEEILLPGANVYWQGTSVGTTTDIDGKFSLKIREEV